MKLLDINKEFVREDNYFFKQDEKLPGAKIVIYYPIGSLNYDYEPEIFARMLTSMIGVNFPMMHMKFVVNPTFTSFILTIVDDKAVNPSIGGFWNTVNKMAGRIDQIITDQFCKDIEQAHRSNNYGASEFKMIKDVNGESLYDISLKRNKLYQNPDYLKRALKKAANYFIEKNANVFYTSKQSLMTDRHKVDLIFNQPVYDLDELKERAITLECEDTLKALFLMKLFNSTNFFQADIRHFNNKVILYFRNDKEIMIKHLSHLRDHIKTVFSKETILEIFNSMAADMYHIFISLTKNTRDFSHEMNSLNSKAI